MKIFLIGFGNMGRAMARALRGLPAQAGAKPARAGHAGGSGYEISVASKDGLSDMTALEHSVTIDNSYSSLKNAEIIILAVKPQDLSALAEEVKEKIGEHAIIVSIAAGVTIEKIKKLFGREKIVRVMPNIGLSVGEGISAWKSFGLSSPDLEKAQALLNDLSENFEVVGEGDIDAVTAISGSGPAYFFLFAQALEKSARALGLNEKQARVLVEKTLSASASLQKGKSYEELISAIASKGGTTEAALRVFNERQLSQIVEDASKAAYNRARKLNE